MRFLQWAKNVFCAFQTIGILLGGEKRNDLELMIIILVLEAKDARKTSTARNKTQSPCDKHLQAVVLRLLETPMFFTKQPRVSDAPGTGSHYLQTLSNVQQTHHSDVPELVGERHCVPVNHRSTCRPPRVGVVSEHD